MTFTRALTSFVVVFVVACGSGTATSSLDDAVAPPAAGDAESAGDFGPGGSKDPPSGDAACAATVAETIRGKVDIVFVIDNSGSMLEELAHIRDNVNAFAKKIGGMGIDYRVVFVTARSLSPTDPGSGLCVPEPLAGPNCADKPPTFFHANLFILSHGSLDTLNLTYESDWKQHLRMDAAKAFVAITDDESNMDSATFDRALLAKKPDGMFGTAAKRNYVFHAIVSKPDGVAPPTSARCPTSAGTSVVYQELSLLTGGIIGEVCKTDYSAVLDNIAKGIVSRVGCELAYPTANGADPDSVVVRRSTKDGASRNLVQVTDASKCSTVEDGWYYDVPAKPTKIILCRATCDDANASTDVKLEALVGCKAPAPR